MLIGSEGRSSSWGHELRRGDVFFSAPGRNFDAVFGERSEVAGISITPEAIATMFGGEATFADVEYWLQNHQYSCAPHLRDAIVSRVLDISQWLQHGTPMSSTAADFWQRALIEAFTSIFVHATPPDAGETDSVDLAGGARGGKLPGCAPHRAVHISELCAALGTSRRTLHRAFHDVLGIGPIAFLRHHRLCAVHSRLRRGDPSTTHVTDVATEFGFLELGRFSHYYAMLFGEYPSQTLHKGPSDRIARLRTESLRHIGITPLWGGGPASDHADAA